MKILNILAAAAVMSIPLATYGQEQEVIQIKYTDGVVDYIPATDVAKISFSKGLPNDYAGVSTVNAMFDRLKATLKASNSHADFGYPAMMIALDAMSADVARPESGYNWFREWGLYKIHNPKVTTTALPWYYMYSTIGFANEVLRTVNGNTDQDRLLQAQAYALRSWAYWNLIQMYAPRYEEGKNGNGVPILPENKTIIDGNLYDDITLPMSSIADVYYQIFSDINNAIDRLTDNTYEPAHIDVADAKKYIDLATAYGLRARYNLTTGKYNEAATDARRAIETTSARCMLPSTAGYPGFNDQKLGNWMWAVTVNESDRCVTSGIVNFTSHVSSLYPGGYVGVGAYHACSNAIYSYFPEHPGDVRKNWWVDGFGEGALLTRGQQNAVSVIFDLSSERNINVKFDSYKSKLSNGPQACDLPLMRVEELYLIEAESYAHLGNAAQATALLNEWVSKYRDPNYMFAPNNADQLIDEILMQRRIELWGEGFGFFDMKRLGRDLDRYGDSAYDDSFVLRIRANSSFMQFCYPDYSPRIEGFDYTTIDTADPVSGADGTWNE